MPADAPGLLELALRTTIETFAHHNDPINFQKYLDETHRLDVFLKEIADENARYLLGDRDGKPAAYARLRWGRAPDCIDDPAAMEIEKFYVDKPFHGQGVAAAMMQQCLDFARERNHRTIFLGVWEHNHRAIAFYTKKWGFERCGEHVFMVGDDPTIDWWMKLAASRPSRP